MTSPTRLVRNPGMLRATAFLLAEHGGPVSLAALATLGRLDAAALESEFGTVDGLVDAVFEDFLVPRTGALLDLFAAEASLEAVLAGFAEGGDGEGRLLAPFLQVSLEARGLFGSRELLVPVLAAMRRDAGLAPPARVVPGEAEIAIALLADFALLAGPTRFFLPNETEIAPASGTALRLVVAGAASALRGLRG